MDFEIELGEIRPLFGQDEGYKEISSTNHILYNGEIYSGSYDREIGGIYWRCITDSKIEPIHHYKYDRKNPFMVQVITYKRTKEKVVPVPEPKLLKAQIGIYEITTSHINHPVIGKSQICKSEIFIILSGVTYIKLESIGITIRQAHDKACLLARSANENRKVR